MKTLKLCSAVLFLLIISAVNAKAQPLRGEGDWGTESYDTPCLGVVSISVHQTALVYFRENGYFWRETFDAVMTDANGNIYTAHQVLNEAGHWGPNYNGHLDVQFLFRDCNGKLAGITRYRGHVTINANGELTAYKDSFEFMCK